MEVFAGVSVQVPVNVIVRGSHIDPDGNIMSAVLSSHPSVVPTVTRHGVGRYTFTFEGLAPALTAGQSLVCTVSGEIASAPWTPFDIPLVVINGANEPSGDTPETLSEIASRPRVVQAGTERIEEHSLRDQIEFDRYQKQQESQSATPGAVPVLRWQQTHGRP